LLAPRPTPKLEDHPLSVFRDCLFAATLHIGGRSSIRHAVVTGTHLSWGKPYPDFCWNMKIRKASVDSHLRY
jgi:hypothetical protein